MIILKIIILAVIAILFYNVISIKGKVKNENNDIVIPLISEIAVLIVFLLIFIFLL